MLSRDAIHDTIHAILRDTNTLSDDIYYRHTIDGAIAATHLALAADGYTLLSAVVSASEPIPVHGADYTVRDATAIALRYRVPDDHRVITVTITDGET